MEQFKKEWTFHDPDIEKTLLEMDKTIISNLETIRKELVPNCKHPNQMLDRAP